MWDRIRLSALGAALWLVCASASLATTLETMSLARLARVAQVIVRVRCLSNSTAWDAGEIWTSTSFEVVENWKGVPPRRITVRLLGGTVGPFTSTISGIPRFRPGEQVILFLESTSRGDYAVVSWQQGTFRIRPASSRATAEDVVTQDTAAFATFDPKTRRFETSGLRNMPVEVFRAQVESALAGVKERTR